LNLRSSGYEPDEIPDFSIPRLFPFAFRLGQERYAGDPRYGKRYFAKAAKFRFNVGAMISSVGRFPILPAAVWQERAESHLAAARVHTAGVRRRRDHGEAHPVEDFLFTYYPYKISLLEQWHPGPGVGLELPGGIPLPPHLAGKRYRLENGICFLDPARMEEKERERLRWVLCMLEATQNRVPNFACHGLHEWAMVYRAAEIRHSSLAPLRLPQEQIESLVESRSITCSHHDAFRFFTKEARPLNRLQPDLDSRLENEQPGCVHANMDLYKWAAKSMPWIGSGLLLEIFRLANQLRDLDMRASPYDLSKWHVVPVKIETAEGRREYETEQRRLAVLAKALRARLIAKLEAVLEKGAVG
jgi:hypothetical protein